MVRSSSQGSMKRKENKALSQEIYETKNLRELVPKVLTKFSSRSLKAKNSFDLLQSHDLKVLFTYLKWLILYVMLKVLDCM